MKQRNLLITATATCLLFTSLAMAGSSDKPSDFQKLQREYHKKAQDKIEPINRRYAELLEQMLKKKLRTGTPEEIQEITDEIAELKVDPRILLTALDIPTDVTLADFEGDWLVTFSNGTKHRVMIDSEGNIKRLNLENSSLKEFKLKYDEKTGKFIGIDGNGIHAYIIRYGKLNVDIWFPANTYPNDNPRVTGEGKKKK